MIRLVCPNCRAKLNAKEKLAGQTKACPKCKTPIEIKIPEPDPVAEPDSDTEAAASDTDAPGATDQFAGPGPSTLLALEVPTRLEPNHRYLICNLDKLVAAWRNDGKGWMLRTTAGLISARRNREMLPKAGDFQLVELQLTQTDDGLRLTGLMTYQLAKSWALTQLDKGDAQILGMVTGPGRLNRNQKNIVRQAVRDQFMHAVWTGAEKVLEFLGSTDFHSSGTN